MQRHWCDCDQSYPKLSSSGARRATGGPKAALERFPAIFARIVGSPGSRFAGPEDDILGSDAI